MKGRDACSLFQLSQLSFICPFALLFEPQAAIGSSMAAAANEAIPTLAILCNFIVSPLQKI